MKAAHAEGSTGQRISGAARRHIVSRLHKAAKYADETCALLSDPSSGATELDCLEARAYAHSLSGTEEFEKQADGVKTSTLRSERWIPCLTNLSAARVVYSALLHTTQEDVFKEAIASTIDPSIRYAAYQHRIPRTTAVSTVSKQFFPSDAADLARTVEGLDAGALSQGKST